MKTRLATLQERASPRRKGGREVFCTFGLVSIARDEEEHMIRYTGTLFIIVVESRIVGSLFSVFSIKLHSQLVTLVKTGVLGTKQSSVLGFLT